MFSPEATHWIAALVLSAAAIVVALAAWRDAARTGFQPRQYPLYWFGLMLTRILWRTRVIGRVELPASSGAVIVSNHRGPIDPAFIGLAVLSRVHWMVAREYFSVPVFGALLRLLESVPTRRGGIDTAAVKQVIRIARGGGLVGVFPEGRINDTDELLLPLRSGAALIALQAKVPIVPCFVHGSPYDRKNLYSFFVKPARTTIKVGKRIELTEYFDRANDRDVQSELMLRIGKAIAELAGCPEFQPQLAAKRRVDSAEPGDEPG